MVESKIKYKDDNNNNNNSNSINDIFRVDKIDGKIIDLMITGRTNKKISSDLHIPLSTVQRRTRKILNKGLVISNISLNYEKFGFRTGLLHVYLANDSTYKIAEKIRNLDGVTSTEIHIGNSDIIAAFTYKENKQLLRLMNNVKSMDGIAQVVWSEKIDSISANQ